MSRPLSSLTEVRKRLDQLVEQRTTSGLSFAEESEYRDLVAVEAELLSAPPAGFGGLPQGDT